MLTSEEWAPLHSITHFTFMPYKRLNKVDYHQYIVALSGDKVWVAFRGIATYEDWFNNSQVSHARAVRY
jgi:hypothetical protein